MRERYGMSLFGQAALAARRLVEAGCQFVTVFFAEAPGVDRGIPVRKSGVRVGEVSELVLTDDGVDLVLDIDEEHDAIPADAHALVGNRSAVG